MHKLCTWGRKQIHQEEIETECKETANTDTVFAVVKPQIWDQSYKKLTKISRSWSADLLVSSNVQAFLSCQTDHIRHSGTKFQTLDWCFPNQFLHPNNKSTTRCSKTHWIPKAVKTKFQSTWTKAQCNNRWSTVSPSKQHILHHSIIVYPRRMRLSQVRIRP